MSPRENSVKQLSELYNVVTGVSLSLAIINLLDSNADGLPIKWDALFNFLSFLVVIIPFHQGAVRHLYATYVEGGGSTRIKAGALAIDFLLLFFQACIFVALSSLIVHPEKFAAVLIALLGVDCIWGVLAHLAFTGAQAQWAEKKWALINFIAGFALFGLYKLGPPLLNGWGESMNQMVFAICFARTVADYSFSWNFYYPPRDHSGSGTH